MDEINMNPKVSRRGGEGGRVTGPFMCVFPYVSPKYESVLAVFLITRMSKARKFERCWNHGNKPPPRLSSLKTSLHPVAMDK